MILSFFTASSKLNTTYEAAIKAKEMFYRSRNMDSVRIHVVDTKCVSLGNGYLVLKSAKMLDNGASYDELVDFCEKYKTRIKHFLTVTDMKSLVDNGLVSSTRSRLTKLLGNDSISKMKNVGESCNNRKTHPIIILCIKRYVDQYQKGSGQGTD